ncbi:MAG: hypothetical protein WCE68_15045 [Anaerolineales bacterium]
MKSQRIQILLGSALLILVLAACSGSPASTASGNKPIPVGNTGNQPMHTAAAPTQAAPVPSSGGCSNAYFPVSTGTNWSYSSSGNRLGAYTYTWTITDASDSGFTTHDVYSTGVTADLKWGCKDGNLTPLGAGADSLDYSTSKMKVTSQSITTDGYTVPSSFRDGKKWNFNLTDDSLVTSGTRSITSQMVQHYECSFAGTDSVTVPAGTFNTAKVICTEAVTESAILQGTPIPVGAPITVNITDWYAKGVGEVQSVRTSIAGGTETIVLTKYNVQ